MYPDCTTITESNKPKSFPSYELLFQCPPPDRRNTNIKGPSIVLENLDISDSDKTGKLIIKRAFLASKN